MDMLRTQTFEKEGPHRHIADGNGRYALPVGGQAGYMGEVVQVPQDTRAVLGATHQEAEGYRCCQACDSLCVSIQGLGTGDGTTGYERDP